MSSFSFAKTVPQYKFAEKYLRQKIEHDLGSADVSLIFLRDNLRTAKKDAGELSQKRDQIKNGEIVTQIEEALTARIEDDDAVTALKIPELLGFIKASKIDIYLDKKEVEKIAKVYSSQHSDNLEAQEVAKRQMLKALLKEIEFQNTPGNVWEIGEALEGPGKHQGKGVGATLKNLHEKATTDHSGKIALIAGGASAATALLPTGTDEATGQKKKMSTFKKVTAVVLGAVALYAGFHAVKNKSWESITKNKKTSTQALPPRA